MIDREEIRRRVLEAIQRGEIPKGGPSELAAHDLLDDVPAAYWERWSEEAVERIREIKPRPRAGEGGHMSTSTAKEAGDRVNQIGEAHLNPIVIKKMGGHVRFHVSTDDGRVLFECDDQGEKSVYWLFEEEAREIAEALNKAVGWLHEEEVASAAYIVALRAGDAG